MSLRLRIGAVLPVFVAVNALFVLALLWAYGVLLPTIVSGSDDGGADLVAAASGTDIPGMYSLADL